MKGKYLLHDHVRALAFVAYHTGMRKGELLDLKWANVNFDKGFIAKAGRHQERQGAPDSDG